jgi:rubrerythrin
MCLTGSQAINPENHLFGSKIVAAIFAAMLQLKVLYAVTGSQTPETAIPQQSTNNQQSESQSTSQQNGPDLSKLSPRLQQPFDHVQNAHLGNIVIAKFSALQVAWSCDQCPNGYPHKWLQKPQIRTANDGCPFCSGKRACRHNSLATKSNTVAASWDYSANEGTPDDYTAGSDYRANWNCQDCGLSWQTRIKSNALEGSGYPHCYKLRRGRKANSSRTSHSTLRGASADHPLMADWDKDANEKAGLHPENIKLRSNIKVNWICRKCPLGLLHLYKAMARDRTQKRSGCPYCAAQKACKCNSLRTHFPELVTEWDYDKNKDTPRDYTARSNKIVWWKTAERGSWQQTIHSRTDRRLKRHQLRALKQ